MKFVYFPQNARDLSLDSFNITYKSKQRAQARLDRSAPCLGLSIFRISNVQYRVTYISCICTLHGKRHKSIRIEVEEMFLISKDR